MWNEQHDSILQKEFGFYFSLDNVSYPNVWIRYATAISKGPFLRKTRHGSDRRSRTGAAGCSKDLFKFRK